MLHKHNFQRFWNDLNELASPNNAMQLKVSTNAAIDMATDDPTNQAMTGLALYSMDEQYRYALCWVWDRTKPIFTAVMLNPSTATESELDPTVTRIYARAMKAGYGAFLVMNLFALRSRMPEYLKVHKDPIGRENDLVLDKLLPHGAIVLCGWGTHGGYRERGKLVEARIRKAEIMPHCLKLTKDGHPNHPLYVDYETKPKEWHSRGK